MPPLELTPDELADVLRHAELDVVGRMRYSSNATFLVEIAVDGETVRAVYKPQRGERPLWDFPEGTLCAREVASYEVSRALGWDIVPVTVMREDAPLGAGSLQRFVEHDPEEQYFTLLAAYTDRFREFAVFDVLANNTDRKGGHCLRDQADGSIVGIDHGLTFHTHWKLRTVIWDFAGESIPPELSEAVCRVVQDAEHGELGARLHTLLSPSELAAFMVRGGDLVESGVFPEPDGDYRCYPWPLV